MRRAFLGFLLLSACGQAAASEPAAQESAPSEFSPTAEPAPPEPAPIADHEPLVEPAHEDAFLGERDAPALEALRTQRITRVRAGRGGRSLAFRITLEDGRRGYFKPEQSFSGAHWYSEVAAYHLDRALGLGRVAPVTGRTIPWRRLENAAADHPRADEATLDGDGNVRGAFIAWIEGNLRPWNLGEGWEHFVRVEGDMEITPYQRPSDYRARVNNRATREETELGSYGPAPETLSDEEIAQLSDLILFDFLIGNVDRWGGDYTNVRRLGSEKLVFLDQGAGFWAGARQGLMDARLEALQRIRRRTHRALGRFDVHAFAERLASDPLAPVLGEARLQGLDERVDAALAHIDRLLARFGEDAVYVGTSD